MSNLPKDSTFSISFNTLPGGYLRAVKVTLFEDAMDAKDIAYLNLRDHQLYKELEAYVKANPSGEI